MKALYSFSIRLLILAFNIAALFNKKAKTLVQGRKNWKQRLQEQLNKLDGNNKIIWFHCSSLGEFEQGRPLITKIKTQYPQYKILLTFFSPSGYEAKKKFEFADIVFYLPFDTKANADAFLNIVKPELIFFIKYEFWLNFLFEIKKRNITCFLISAIFRKHQPFFKWYGNIFKEALDTFTVIFIQDELSVRLLNKINTSSTKLLVGDTRIDRVIEISNQTAELPIVKKFCNTMTVIAGSTWHKDEEILIPIIARLKNQFSLKLIIAPHEPSEKNINHITALLDKNKLTYLRYTHLSDMSQGSDVLIIDTIGILSRLYRYGYLSYIGGGFDDGIHNTLEPAVYHLPIIFGTQYHKFFEAVELVKSKGAFSIENGEKLFLCMNTLLTDNNVYVQSQQAIDYFITSNKGAVDKTLEYLQPYLTKAL